MLFLRFLRFFALAAFLRFYVLFYALRLRFFAIFLCRFLLFFAKNVHFSLWLK